MRKPQFVLLALLLLAALQVWHYLPLLPERVASHFNGQGIADGFATKADFARVEMMVCALMVLVFLLLPKIFRFLPVSMINLPNKDYWFSEERREGTLNALEDSMGWFGVLTLLLLLAVMQMAIRANLEPKPHLDSSVMIPLLVGYLGAAAVWVVFLLMRFRRPAQ